MSTTEAEVFEAVVNGSRVKLHFSLRLETGETVDSTFDREPAELTVGDGNLPEGFEKHLLGLKTGTRQTFSITPEDGFGQYNPSNTQVISRSQFAPDMELANGLVVSFADKSGSELPGVITEYDDQSVTVDFNHPLAGKTLDFEVEVLAVASAE